MKTPSNRRKYPKRFRLRPPTLDVPASYSDSERQTVGEIVRITGYNRNPAGKIVSMTAERGRAPKVLSAEEWGAFVRAGIHFHGALSDTPSGCLLIKGDGTLSASALAKLSKWGLPTRDFNVGYKGGAK